MMRDWKCYGCGKQHTAGEDAEFCFGGQPCCSACAREYERMMREDQRKSLLRGE